MRDSTPDVAKNGNTQDKCEQHFLDRVEVRHTDSRLSFFFMRFGFPSAVSASPRTAPSSTPVLASSASSSDSDETDADVGTASSSLLSRFRIDDFIARA